MAYFEIGKQYELNVIDLRQDSANNAYIALDDPSNENIDIRVYNLLDCQLNDLPEKMYVTVSQDVLGRLRFRQDIKRVFQDNYKEGKLYSFDVVGSAIDINTHATYLEIEDSITTHRFYYQGEAKYKVGDSCILEFDGLTDSGFARFKEKMSYEEAMASLKAEQTPAKTVEVDAESSFANIEEGKTVEFKTSIAYVPGGELNIDKQINTIVTVLASFMNTDGGKLYIGVHDASKRVTGIEADYEHLNSSKDDDGFTNYKQDRDGFELKIRNAVDMKCRGLAGGLIEFTFGEENGHTYCCIEVTKSPRPVYINGTKLFVRQGNRNKQLRGDEITNFVMDRLVVNANVNVAPSLGVQNDIVEIIKTAMKSIINMPSVRMAVPVGELPPARNLGAVEYLLVWNEDSTWMRVKEGADTAGAEFVVPVSEGDKDALVVFCYKNGFVNTVKLKDFRKGANLGKVQKAGWSTAAGKPERIFVASNTDYLVIRSIESSGLEYVKLHSVSCINPTQAAKNQGVTVMPKDGYSVTSYDIVGAHHEQKLKNLIYPTADRGKTAGVTLSSQNPTHQEAIDYLLALLKPAE